MTMYLPNRDIRPTGDEVAEFIEPTFIAPVPDPRPVPALDDDDDDDETAP
jgi:hypothetical protein